MIRRCVSLASLAVALAAALPISAREAAPPAPPRLLSDSFEGIDYRSLGPNRGGRVTTVTGVRGQPLTFFMGATGGGVWKTSDGGGSWIPLGSRDFKTGSVGAIAICETDPEVVYAGMGEAPIRGNVSHGDGVYKSTDGGRSFSNVGLRDSHQISKVLVHPKNPDTVYVAAQGHVWGPSAERGIYRSTDGGKSWSRLLFVDDRTGASDLAWDPRNPRILFAGMWTVERKPWELSSGGTAGGLFRSMDGGNTWKKLTKDLPEGVVGKVGVSVSGARPGRVFALIEAEKGGLFRSDNYGDTWTRVNEDNSLRQRAWYYTGVYADPKAADTVYVTNVRLHKSIDGGKSFQVLPDPHGDNHDLWIDPDDPSHLIKGDDGGAAISFDGGRNWSTLENQPTGQFYRVITDDRTPYWVYGAQQDNSTVAIPSRVREGSIARTNWYTVGGCESGWIAPKPGDPEIVYAGCYGGSITRYDHRTGEEREIVAWPQLAVGQAPKNLKYRFQWNAPILASRHEPGVIYHAAQVLLRSRDEGQTWEEISPDLTRNDKTKQGYSGGPITRDNTGVEVYGSIFYLAESPHEKAVLWAGTDDGLVHVTRDGGKNWQNVTPREMPQEIQINAIDVSPHEKDTVTIAATRYKFDDFRPYLYRTSDGGKSWTKIVNGIPENTFTRVVREDPGRKGLLFAGTETGVYVSFNSGARWEPFQRNLPAVPVTDMVVKGDDLVLSTQGRGFWILDDLSPLRQWTESVASEPAFLFQPGKAILYPGGSLEKDREYPAAGKNAPGGAVIDFWLKEKPGPKEPVKLEILDGEKVLRTFTSEKKEEKEPAAEGEKPLELLPGVNRFIWDLRSFRPDLLPKAVLWGDKRGPRVGAGTYSVRLTAGGKVLTKSFETVPNPAVAVSPEALKAQASMLAEIRDRMSDVHFAVRQIRDLKTQVENFVKRAEKPGKAEPLKAHQKSLNEKLSPIEEKLVNPKLVAEQDVLNFTPGLDHQLAGIASTVSSAAAAPTAGSAAYFEALKKELEQVLSTLQSITAEEVPKFNRALKEAGMEPVDVLVR